MAAKDQTVTLGIGIDTGGTYTDCVLYDFKENKVLASGKSLTTRENLSLGIGKALDFVPRELAQKAEIISQSTTLATNACVENKGGRAKLVFIGVDRRVVKDVGEKYGLPDADQICFLKAECKMDGEIVSEPDWDAFAKLCEEWFRDTDAAAVVELCAMNNGGVLEEKARDLILQSNDIPVICGHELFSDLNSVRRGAGALLNARLITVIDEFLKAIRSALSERGISAPVVIVRSDGSLMSGSFAGERPVETLLCGPAASVMGGCKLTGEKDCLVVDMGGTTTDIAIVKDGVPVQADGGVNVGKWRTFVKGLYIDTFGLGGDSAVRYREHVLYLDEVRVVPICILSDQYPEVIRQLTELIESKGVFSYFAHEFFVLLRDIEGNPNYTDREQKFCAELKKFPLIWGKAAEVMGEDVYNFQMERLEKEGVIIRAGLTPTDVMHIVGDFNRYSPQASLLAAKYVGRCSNRLPIEICNMVYERMKKKLYCNLVRILLEDYDPYYKIHGLEEGMKRLISKSYEDKKKGMDASFVQFGFQTPASLVGIGAPIHIFLPDVAKMLGTRCVIPKYAQVANALGAVVGNVSAVFKVTIKPNYEAELLSGCTVLGGEEPKTFETYEQALQAALKTAEEGARKEAYRRGARGHLKVTTNVKDSNTQTKGMSVYFGSEIYATAVGRISLEQMEINDEGTFFKKDASNSKFCLK